MSSFMVGTSSFELLTPSVSRKCSTPELRAYIDEAGSSNTPCARDGQVFFTNYGSLAHYAKKNTKAPRAARKGRA